MGRVQRVTSCGAVQESTWVYMRQYVTIKKRLVIPVNQTTIGHDAWTMDKDITKGSSLLGGGLPLIDVTWNLLRKYDVYSHFRKWQIQETLSMLQHVCNMSHLETPIWSVSKHSPAWRYCWTHGNTEDCIMDRTARPCAWTWFHPNSVTEQIRRHRVQMCCKIGREQGKTAHISYPPITYYWTVPLILDHSYLVGNLTNSIIAETKALNPLNPDTFVSAIFKLVNFPATYEWSKIRGTVQE